MDARQAVTQLHQVYCRLTGFNLPLDMAREMAWFEVHRRGITPGDIGILIAHLQREIRSDRRNPGCLKFRNLVGNPDYMEEDLQEAKARLRSPRVDPARADVLQATGRPSAADPPSARPASAVLPPEEVARRCREAMAEARRRINSP